MDAAPLSDDRIGVCLRDGPVIGAMPHRYRRPGTGMRRGPEQPLLQAFRIGDGVSAHAIEGFRD